jgi:formate dehydrogenase major subunit
MVVFMNEQDMADRGIAPEALVEMQALADPATHRVASGFRARPYRIPRGSIAAYYPETNNLMPLSLHDPKCKTPSGKCIPVLVRPMVPG